MHPDLGKHVLILDSGDVSQRSHDCDLRHKHLLQFVPRPPRSHPDGSHCALDMVTWGIYVRGPINFTHRWVAAWVPRGCQDRVRTTTPTRSYLPSGQQSELVCTWSSPPGFVIPGATFKPMPRNRYPGGNAPRRTIFGQNYLQIAPSPRSITGCGVLTANLQAVPGWT